MIQAAVGVFAERNQTSDRFKNVANVRAVQLLVGLSSDRWDWELALRLLLCVTT